MSAGSTTVGQSEARREGSLEAPKRHPLDWTNPEFYDEQKLMHELERVFDICHGCRRCFNLCNAFPTLFDLIDESSSMELDGVASQDYWQVVDHCYLCDMCFMTKCPYVPPHEWNVDFPHLMLRAKAVKHTQGKTRLRDKVLSATDQVGKLASIPVVVNIANAVNKDPVGRSAMESVLGVDKRASIPTYHSPPFRKRMREHLTVQSHPQTAGPTVGQVALFTTCYGNYCDPAMAADLVAVFEHNDVPVKLVGSEQCCGMPKLELGDLEAVARAKQANIAQLARLVDEGYDIVAPIPSCALMFRQELPLMFPDDEQVVKVSKAIFDPCEYLIFRHRAGLLRLDFHRPLGSVAYHVACHQRVQNIGPRTRELLELAPDTKVTMVERCSGHDGTYAVKKEFHKVAMKIAQPIARRFNEIEPDHYTSDCIMAGRHIQNAMGTDQEPQAPLSLMRKAYGI